MRRVAAPRASGRHGLDRSGNGTETTLEARQALRAEAGAFSSDVVRVVAEHGGHDIITDEPTLVSRTVLSVVAAVRGNQPVKSVWASQIGESADE